MCCNQCFFITPQQFTDYHVFLHTLPVPSLIAEGTGTKAKAVVCSNLQCQEHAFTACHASSVPFPALRRPS